MDRWTKDIEETPIWFRLRCDTMKRILKDEITFIWFWPMGDMGSVKVHIRGEGIYLAIFDEGDMISKRLPRMFREK